MCVQRGCLMAWGIVCVRQLAAFNKSAYMPALGPATAGARLLQASVTGAAVLCWPLALCMLAAADLATAPLVLQATGSARREHPAKPSTTNAALSLVAQQVRCGVCWLRHAGLLCLALGALLLLTGCLCAPAAALCSQASHRQDESRSGRA